MSLENLGEYSWWDLDAWSDKIRQDSEKVREKKDNYTKSLAWIKRVQKDEKKAQKNDNILVKIIVEILKDPKYDILIPFIIDLLEISTPPNFIIGTVSLINEDLSNFINKNYINKENWLIIEENINNKLILKYKKTKEFIKFDADSLDKNLQTRINKWIEDILKIISFDPSLIISNRFINYYNEDQTKMINLLASVFTFFLYNQNILIDKNTSFTYCKFILWEVYKKVKGLKLEEI